MQPIPTIKPSRKKKQSDLIVEFIDIRDKIRKLESRKDTILFELSNPVLSKLPYDITNGEAQEVLKRKRKLLGALFDDETDSWYEMYWECVNAIDRHLEKQND